MSVTPSIVHLQDDGEKQKSKWEDFLIPLFDENGDPKLDENGNHMKAVAYDPSTLQTRVFLTRPDQNGEQRRARVVEMLKAFDDNLESNEERKQFIKDLKYRVVYDRKSHMDSPIDDVVS